MDLNTILMTAPAWLPLAAVLVCLVERLRRKPDDLNDEWMRLGR